MTPIEENIKWIRSGKIGCTFATALIKQRDKIGWLFMEQNGPLIIPEGAFVLSLVFPCLTALEVRAWAIENGFAIEKIDDLHEGLRINMKGGVSWVQYFGPDSHVKTRQSPHPMLSFAVKLPAHIYAKTMAKGVLHLAHASIEFLSFKKCNRFWETSHKRSEQIIGHELGISEAAKVTFKL